MKEIDATSGTETTGHEWDGIKELNTPLPRWWLWTFYATVVWAVVYALLYPAWPLVTSATPPVSGLFQPGRGGGRDCRGQGRPVRLLDRISDRLT